MLGTWFRSTFLALLIGAAAGCGPAAPAVVNCSANPAGCVCTGDSQCGGDNPRCEAMSGKCVPCLPTNDNCGAPKKCLKVSGAYACATGCAADKDCPKAGTGAPQVCCNNICVDTLNDSKNCGGCGTTCPMYPNANAICDHGSCAVGDCTVGFAVNVVAKRPQQVAQLFEAAVNITDDIEWTLVSQQEFSIPITGIVTPVTYWTNLVLLPLRHWRTHCK